MSLNENPTAEETVEDVTERPSTAPDAAAGSRRLTVVGIGASAGGLAALEDFFDALPAGTGMAFVVVTHMDPGHKSHLPELLGRHAKLPVAQVEGPVAVQPERVYVIPPARRILFTDSHLDVEAFQEERGYRTPIDDFFHSLSEIHRNAIAIILSGSGSDGAAGVQAVKAAGGMLLVQDPDEAEYDSMPRAAIRTGLADAVLPVARLAAELEAYVRSNAAVAPEPGPHLNDDDLAKLERIVAEVYARTGYDLSRYGRTGLLRPIRRRMAATQCAGFTAYLAELRAQPAESRRLLDELSGGEARFFGNRQAWDALARQVIPRAVQSHPPGEDVRVWVIGCGTGEEAYSLAILFHEYLSKLGLPDAARPTLQIFATDLSGEALATARLGLYPKTIEEDVSPERLKRFFVKQGDEYRVGPDLREALVFDRHSVLHDPPYLHLDLISCPNLLPLLEPEAQEHVGELFHYSLNPEGYLFLGDAKTAGPAPGLFRTLDGRNRIYQARRATGEHAVRPALPARGAKDSAEPARMKHAPERASAASLATRHYRLLEEVAPPSVLVSTAGQVLHVSPSAGRYLRQPGGPPTSDLLRLIRPELQSELRELLLEAVERDQAVLGQPVAVRLEEAVHRVALFVRPHRPVPAEGDPADERRVLLVFLEQEAARERQPAPPLEAPEAELVARLTAETESLRRRLHMLRANYESSTRELRTTNQELDVSREELQSVNEELRTVNAELISKLEDVGPVESDLKNLLASVEIGTLVLDRDLRIQRYSPATAELFHIKPQDMGRPAAHLAPDLEYPELVEDAQEVLRTLTPIEREVRDQGGRWLLARVRPYLSVDERVEGAVFAFVDITPVREAQHALRRTRERYRLLVDETREYAMLTMDERGRIDMWNQGAERIFGFKEAEVLGESAALIFTAQDVHSGEFERELERARRAGQSADERWHVRRDGSRFWGSGVVTALMDEGQVRGYAKVLRDNTIRKKTEAALQASEARYRALAETLEARVQERTAQVRSLAAELVAAEQTVRTRISQTLHDDLQQVLYAASVQLQLLRDDVGDGEVVATLDSALKRAIHLTRELTVELHPPLLQGEGLAEAFDWLAPHMYEAYGLAVQIEVTGDPHLPVEEQRILLFQIVRELLFNVVKHAGVREATVTLREEPGGIALTVGDEGRGFDVPAVLGEGQEGAEGFGLRSVSDRMQLFGGRVEIDSEPGAGTRIFLYMPAQKASKVHPTEPEE